MSFGARPVRCIDSSTTARARATASVSVRVPLRAVPIAVRQAETMTASGMTGPLWSGALGAQARRLPGAIGRTTAGGPAIGRTAGADIHSPTVKIVLDAQRCTGHGRCYSLAPELFDSDDEGHSVVLASEVPAGLESQARLAVQNCPETCI